MQQTANILPFLFIIFALLSIIPAGIVFIAIRSRQFAQDHRIDASFIGKEAVDSCIKLQQDTTLRIDRLDGQILQLEESLRAFVNRANVRERHEKKRMEEEERIDQRQNLPEIDKTILDFPIPQNTLTEQPKRLTLKKKAG